MEPPTKLQNSSATRNCVTTHQFIQCSLHDSPHDKVGDHVEEVSLTVRESERRADEDSCLSPPSSQRSCFCYDSASKHLQDGGDNLRLRLAAVCEAMIHLDNNGNPIPQTLCAR